MFSKPIHGWTDITIGDFTGRGSYLTDIPMDVLDAFISSLDCSIPASIYFNEEGSEFILVSHYNSTYIIVEREKTELISIDIDYLELIKEAIKDIEDNLEGWVYWESFYDLDEDEVNKRRLALLDKIEKVKLLLEEWNS